MSQSPSSLTHLCKQLQSMVVTNQPWKIKFSLKCCKINIKQISLSNFGKQKLVCHVWNDYFLNKIDQTKVAVLESLCFKWCILSTNKNDIAVYFSEEICQFLSVCFIIYVTKISDKTDNSLLNYSKLWWGPVLLSMHCTMLSMWDIPYDWCEQSLLGFLPTAEARHHRAAVHRHWCRGCSCCSWWTCRACRKTRESAPTFMHIFHSTAPHLFIASKKQASDGSKTVSARPRPR